MEITAFTFNPFQENTYVLWDDSKECVIVDPGCYEAHEEQELASFIEENQLKVVALLNTHGHVDHVLGNYWVKNKYAVKLGVHEIDEATLRSVSVYASSYGFNNYTETLPDFYLKEGEEFSFGNSKLKILFVPGHAPGHIAFYNQVDGTLIGGDVLFRQSIGRTDLPGGDFDTLIESIKTKLFVLPDETRVFPGHGPETSIGYEKGNNPFLQ